MPPNPFVLVTPGATRGLGLSLTRQFLRTTSLPVYATHRTRGSEKSVADKIMEPLKDVDPKRLNLLHLDLTSEESIAKAAHNLDLDLQEKNAAGGFIHTAFITGGMLVPERAPSDLEWDVIKDMFQINVISHMLIIKHFCKFLPLHSQKEVKVPAKWVHVSARVGSISDNHRGGWYSYRSSKAALNQVVKTFDIYMQQHKNNAMCVGVHPGTMRTDLSRGFWESAARDELFEPANAASNLVNVVENLSTAQRGKVWDWSGKEVPW